MSPPDRAPVAKLGVTELGVTELVVTPAALSGYTHNRPSLFADPVAWLVAELVRARLVDGPAPDPERTGLVVVSAVATGATMGRIAVTARSGQVSPLRFAGANPGVVAGLACIRSGLRGPALLLTMAPIGGLPVATMMARAWLRDGAATAVLVVTHELTAEAHRLRCVLHPGPAR